MAHHCPTPRPRTEVMGESATLVLQSLQMGMVPPNGTRPRPNAGEFQTDAPGPWALLPPQFISLHPAPSKSLHSSLQSPYCPASESQGPSSVLGFLSPFHRPFVRSRGGVGAPGPPQSRRLRSTPGGRRREAVPSVIWGAGLGPLRKGAGWPWEGSGPEEHTCTNLPDCLARSPSWELEGGPVGWTGERTAGRRAV